MNTENGSFLTLPDGNEVPEGHVALKHHPNPHCGICRGNGTNRRIIKKLGKRGKFQFEYLPCPCTSEDIDMKEEERRQQAFQRRLDLIDEPAKEPKPVQDEAFMRTQAGKFMRKVVSNRVATAMLATSAKIFEKTAEPPHAILDGQVTTPKPTAPVDMVPDLPDISKEPAVANP